ncbi:YaaA family protein [Collinsella tanakaei]|uniref:YaaA family protein n=1 Tax=Collinsella tanakaei TaxID=626935 RepID=UPI0022E6D7FF|nr:YaaA family protein [Collinsella tanakaei]
MLQVIISPAKQMRVCASAFAAQGIPPYPQRTATLHQRLLQIEHQDGKDALQALWSVSDRLLQQNLDRLHAFEPLMDAGDLNNPELARLVSPAAFSYVGIQYQSMAPEVLDQESLAWLQSHLWILSGLYGCVRPFDAVQPYRLEMGAKLAADGAKNLYAFWGDALARAVCGYMDDETPPQTGAAAHEGTCVVNLASVEYAKAVLPHLDQSSRCITCIFGEDLRAGKPVQRSTASKTARGSMVRWMAENRIEDPADLTRFNVGYAFSPQLSSNYSPTANAGGNQTLVFMKS